MKNVINNSLVGTQNKMVGVVTTLDFKKCIEISQKSENNVPVYKMEIV